MSLSIPFSRQQRITNTLLLNASFIDNLGLMHGKMGIAIYFFHLAHETKNSIYEDYAGELIDEIYDEINIHTPCDFENGLAGIGWGIEYLVQNGFIEADTNEVLEDFDNRIIHEVTHHVPEDIGILQGICGYIVYFLKRLKKGCKNKIFVKKALSKTVLLLEKYIDKIDTDFSYLWREPEKFDITWNYPSVLYVLTELYHAGHYKETEQIYVKLLSVYKDHLNLPQLQSHRLLFTLSIEKLKQLEYENFSNSYLTELSKQLIAEITREKINEELEANSAFLQHGAYGISLIYQQLFLLTQIPLFEIELSYWKSCCLEFSETEQGYAGYHIKNEDEYKAFGLLNGLAGIGLNEIKQIQKLNKQS